MQVKFREYTNWTPPVTHTVAHDDEDDDATWNHNNYNCSAYDSYRSKHNPQCD